MPLHLQDLHLRDRHHDLIIWEIFGYIFSGYIWLVWLADISLRTNEKSASTGGRKQRISLQTIKAIVIRCDYRCYGTYRFSISCTSPVRRLMLSLCAAYCQSSRQAHP